MDLKSFFKFEFKKLILPVLLYGLNIFFMVLGVIFAMDVTSNNSASINSASIMRVAQIFAPFSFLQFGLVFNIIYYYLLSCIVIFSINNKDKRTLFAFFGILLFTTVGFFGMTYFDSYRKVSILKANEQMGNVETLDGPYGSLEYPRATYCYNSAKVRAAMAAQNNFDGVLSNCIQISLNATFNNGKNIKEVCCNLIDPNAEDRGRNMRDECLSFKPKNGTSGLC